MKKAYVDWGDKLAKCNAFHKKVLKQGSVYKKGEQSYSGWKKRYLRLWNTKLLEYFTNDVYSERKGWIDLSNLSRGCIMESALTCRVKGEAAEYGISIITKSRTWELCTVSSKGRKEWIEILKVCISLMHPCTLPSSSKLWLKWPYSVEHSDYGLRKISSESKHIFRYWLRKAAEVSIKAASKKISSQKKVRTGMIYKSESRLFLSNIIRPSDKAKLTRDFLDRSVTDMDALNYEFDNIIALVERLVVRYSAGQSIDEYFMISQLGFGGISQFILVQDLIEGGQFYVMKVTPKLRFYIADDWREQQMVTDGSLKPAMIEPFHNILRVQNERRILQRLSTDHRGVCRMYYAFQDSLNLYTVLDYVSGGNLLYQMQIRGFEAAKKFSEPGSGASSAMRSVDDDDRKKDSESGDQTFERPTLAPAPKLIRRTMSNRPIIPGDKRRQVSTTNYGVLTEEECLMIIAQMILIFDFLHYECGIVYRGLKMEHLLMDEAGYIVLSDFKDSKYIGRRDRRGYVETETEDEVYDEEILEPGAEVQPGMMVRDDSGGDRSKLLAMSETDPAEADDTVSPISSSLSSAKKAAVKSGDHSKSSSASLVVKLGSGLRSLSSRRVLNSKTDASVRAGSKSLTAAGSKSPPSSSSSLLSKKLSLWSQRPRTNSDVCANEEYRAPEMINLGGLDHSSEVMVIDSVPISEKYGFETDWWALGCLMYELLHGYPPFCDYSSSDVSSKSAMYIARCDRIKRGKHQPIKRTLSDHCQSLLNGLLEINPVKRLNNDGHQLMKHSFFKSVDWSKLKSHSLDLPFKPLCEIHNDLDVSNFDPVFTQTNPLWFHSLMVQDYYQRKQQYRLNLQQSVVDPSAALSASEVEFTEYEDVFADSQMAWDYPM